MKKEPKKSTQGFTPGPWLAIQAFIYATDNTFIATVSQEKEVENQAQANATLMAAAPELLEACQVAFGYINKISTLEQMGTLDASITVVKLKESISKATGGGS